MKIKYPYHPQISISLFWLLYLLLQEHVSFNITCKAAISMINANSGTLTGTFNYNSIPTLY